MNRKKAARLGQETVALVDAGMYESGGERVDIRAAVRAAIDGTREYPPGEGPPLPAPTARATRVEVTTETTLAACRRLAHERPAALHFGSARVPGGGVLEGARAQDESLCRCSALFACLRDRRMYAFHAGSLDPFYSDWVIHAPAVPVIRADDGALLPAPYEVSFVTSPAVNRAAVLEHTPEREPEVGEVMARRARKILSVVAAHGHASLALGAWGCGVVRNDPESVARMFRDALSGPFRGVFSRVVFAVLDAEDGPTVSAFRSALEA